MKRLIIIADGMSDNPLDELGRKTPLQIAKHPAMDSLVKRGICGTIKTLPDELEAGSDVAIMSILGYNPLKYYCGRGPIEAASIGVHLNRNDIAFRCNLITKKKDKLKDYSAGHIENKQAKKMITKINKELGSKGEIEFYSGVSYRHLLILRGKKYSDKLICTPPHDAVGKKIENVLVKSKDKESIKTANILNQMIISSENILQNHLENKKRVKLGLNPANMIWPWGQGRKPMIKSIKEIYGIKGAVISAVDIVKGLGILAGLDIINVPGATGYFDTDYEAKAEYAIKCLEKYDLVIVHVEATDEAGHSGDPNLKIRAIEDLDKRMISHILKQINGEYSVALLPDHPTPCDIKTHTKKPVPYAIFSTRMQNNNLNGSFNEEYINNNSIGELKGTEFLRFFLSKMTD